MGDKNKSVDGHASTHGNSQFSNSIADTSVSSLASHKLRSENMSRVFSSFSRADFPENPLRPAFGNKELRFDG